MAKEKKPRAEKYDKKLAINGTFEDLIKVSVNYTPPEKAKKAPKKKKYMKGIEHEVWEDTEGCTMLFRADKRGDDRYLQPEKDSKLIHSFYASSHFEAMTIYYQFQGWGVYQTDYESDKKPYPELKIQ